MAIAPRFAAHIVHNFGPLIEPAHTLELYVDYVCPFSARLFLTVEQCVLPLLSHYRNLRVVLRHQVQPWHPSSTLTHEAALAVERLVPSRLWGFSTALMTRQHEFFDVSVVHETRNQTYARLAVLAEEAVSVRCQDVHALLRVAEHPDEKGMLNTGNQVTNDLKIHIKAARLLGIHVSPTVVFNGIVEDSISSKWTKEQWEQWLEENVV